MVDTMPIIIVSTVFITLISYMLIDSFWGRKSTRE